MNNDALAGFLFAEMIKEIDAHTSLDVFSYLIDEMRRNGANFTARRRIDHNALDEIERVFVKAVTKYNNKEGVW